MTDFTPLLPTRGDTTDHEHGDRFAVMLHPDGDRVLLICYVCEARGSLGVDKRETWRIPCRPERAGEEGGRG